MKRKSMSSKHSKKVFSKGNRVHKRNEIRLVMRGGYRM